MTPADTDGYVRLSRELWGEVLVALDSGDSDFRSEVYADVMRLAPVSWDADLDDRMPPAGVVFLPTGPTLSGPHGL